MLATRQAQLLRLVIETYIATAEPIGSQFLVAEGGLEVSGATVRNELRELEEDGFLTHPHTSAGRIPTEQGYRYFVDHIMEPATLKKRTKDAITDILKDKSGQGLKQLGKFFAEEARAAVVVALSRNSVYYTGISGLFAQAEFRYHTFTVDVSHIFDRCEEQLPLLFDMVADASTKILIGEANPLGAACGTVMTKLPGQKLVAIVGPMRMNYAYAAALTNAAHAMITQEEK